MGRSCPATPQRLTAAQKFRIRSRPRRWDFRWIWRRQPPTTTYGLGPIAPGGDLRWTWGSGPAVLSLDPFSMLELVSDGQVMMGAAVLNEPRRGDV